MRKRWTQDITSTVACSSLLLKENDCQVTSARLCKPIGVAMGTYAKGDYQQLRGEAIAVTQLWCNQIHNSCDNGCNHTLITSLWSLNLFPYQMYTLQWAVMNFVSKNCTTIWSTLTFNGEILFALQEILKYFTRWFGGPSSTKWPSKYSKGLSLPRVSQSMWVM